MGACTPIIHYMSITNVHGTSSLVSFTRGVATSGTFTLSVTVMRPSDEQAADEVDHCLRLTAVAVD